MKGEQLEMVSKELLIENKIEDRFKEIELELLKRKVLASFSFKRIDTLSFDVSDYLVLNCGNRK